MTNIVKTNYMRSGMIDQSFYTNYIYDELSFRGRNLMNETLEKNDFIEYNVFSISNNKLPQCTYSEFWLFDCFPATEYYNGYYYPVFIKSINTSSGYAMSRCHMDNEDNDEDNDSDNDNSKSLSDILYMIPASMRDKAHYLLKDYF